MNATKDANSVVSLTERLLSEHQHTGVDMGDSISSTHGIPHAVGVLDAEKPSANGDEVLDTDDDVQFDFESTFRFMTQRRLQRRYRGVYKQYSFTAQLVTWLVVLYTLSVSATLAFRATMTNITINTQSTKSDKTAFLAIAILILVYLFVRVALLIRWMVYWVVVAAMLVYTVTGEIESVFWLDEDEASGITLTPAKKRARNGIMIALLAVEILTVAVYYFTHYTYPWLVLHNKFNTLKWWDVQRHATKGNTLTYRSQARRFYTTKRNVITYCGGLDAERRPHGFGMWSDSSFHGERLTGQWDHGIPTAPYRSFEHGSGYCFVNLRIGYCHVRGEERPEQISFIPSHSKDGLHWGVGSVECSVSGGFFTFLPAVRHLTPHNGTGDDTPKNAAEVEPLLRSPTDRVTFRTEDPSNANEPRRKNTRTIQKRFPSTRGLLYKENSCPILDADTLDPSDSTIPPVQVDGGGKEALILLHGYNCSLNYAMNRLAQLLALGDFPTSIHPYVFSWPSGGALAYFQAQSMGSQNDATALAFSAFLQSLIDAGYTTIHILAHSMGARVYFHALNKGHLENIFEHDDVGEDGFVPEATSSPTIRRARLATLTFTNADYERNEFVRRGGSYDKSRRFCRCITVYADNMDGALFYSEIFSKTSVFGPLNYSLGKRGHMLHRDPEDRANALETGDSGVGSADGVGANVPQHNLHNLTAAEMDVAVALINQRGHYDGVEAFAFNRKRRIVSPLAESSLRRRLTVTTATSLAVENDDDTIPLKYLDLDVIDTTWMDNNVHSIRHNYFNLNPTVVDDLRYLVLEQQRASSRPGLLKTSENVYIFLVAPSHVKNK